MGRIHPPLATPDQAPPRGVFSWRPLASVATEVGTRLSPRYTVVVSLGIEAPVALPTFDQFIDPLLRVLALQTEPMAAKTAHDAVAQMLGLTEPQLQETLSGGQPVYKNRCGWAHDRLKRTGYSSSPRRGYWQLTPAGIEFERKHPAPLPPDQIARIAFESTNIRLRPHGEESDTADSGTLQAQSPDERLEEAVAEIRASVAQDLLEQLRLASPSFFEQIVLDLLHTMGYGTDKSALQHVGSSGDGGIDGIISLDRFGLEKVYIQAKRWQGSVGRPDIQAFYGALAGQHATKGVFITTSTFTAQAIQYAASIEKLVLVDGTRLCSLMIDHGVGVSLRQVKIPRVDGDYFEESGR